MKPQRLSPAPLASVQAKRVCIVKPSALGDVVQSLPILDALRRRFPRATISWVVRRQLAPLLAGVPGLDEVIEFDRHLLRGGRPWRRDSPLRRFAAELRGRRFDLTVDLQGLLRTGWMSRATAAPRRLGLRSAREGAALCYTDVVDDGKAPPDAVSRYWTVAETLGVGHLEPRFDLGLTERELDAADRLLAGLPRPLLAVHPGAAWVTKRWPPERFALAASAALATGGSAVVLGGPGEQPLAAAVVRGIGRPRIDLSGRLNLRGLAAVLSRCDRLLAGDSGPAHLSAAVGTPVVAVFTCTDPARALAYGAGNRAVRTEVACRGSYRKHCASMACMTELTAERVAPVLHEVMPAAGRHAA